MMAWDHDDSRRRIDGAPRDWMSDLPANVIDNIMSRLPLGDAVRLSTLSRKSTSIWMSLPCLKFDAQFFKDVLKNQQSLAYDQFYSIVCKILRSHRGPVHQFLLHIPNLISTSTSIPDDDLRHLVAFLSINGVRELSLENCNPAILNLPSEIFACVELEILKLSYCIFSVPCNSTSFKNLTRLELVNMRFIGDILGSFISRCPALKSLVLTKFSGVDHVAINAPNLNYLVVYGRFKSICLTGSVALSSVTIGLLLNKARNDHVNPSARELVATTARDLVDFLSSSSTMEYLCFEAHFFRFLAGPRFWGTLMETFNHLKRLRLSNIDLTNGIFSHLCLVSMIESCPNLEELIISFESSKSQTKWKIRSDLDENRFCRLRRMYVLSISGVDEELILIRSILLSCPALEKLYIQKSIHAGIGYKSWSLPRPRGAQIICLDPTIRI